MVNEMAFPARGRLQNKEPPKGPITPGVPQRLFEEP